ncbi:MAG: dihydropteroate synthase [Pseudomonadota bacterium]
MLDPLTKADLKGFAPDARIYCQPTCLVERPHGLDGRVARIADTMVWFASWQIAVRERGGTVSEALVPVEELADWSAAMPDALAVRASAQVAAVSTARAELDLKGRSIRFAEPQIMGILNCTPDSFSDGGKYGDPERACATGVDMAAAGAAIVDVGGESTRPGAPLVWEGDEIARIIPVIERLVRAGVAVSVDTRKAGVMEAALSAGAAMVNDVSALGYDDRAAAVVAKAGCPVVLMHAPSQTSNPHANSRYDDILYDVFDWLEAAIARAVLAGISRDKIIVDPGIGFGKGVQENLRLTGGLALYHALGQPLLFGASRKRMIGALDGEAEVDARLGGSIALAYQAASVGAQLHRVHDVAETRQALRVWRAGRDAALTRV